MKKHLGVIVSIGIVFIVLLAASTLYFPNGNLNAPSSLPREAVMNVKDITMPWGSLKVPTEWNVEAKGSDMTIGPVEKSDLIVAVYDAGAFADTLKSIKLRFSGMEVHDVVTNAIQGQEYLGEVISDVDGSKNLMAVSVILHNKRALVMSLRDATNQQTLALYRSLVQSTIIQDVLSDDVVKGYMPPSLRDGITVTRSFTEGKHMIQGTVMAPTPCHTVSVDPSMDGPESTFVMLTLSIDAPADVLCTQVLTEKPFTVFFQAARDASIRASYHGLPVKILGL